MIAPDSPSAAQGHRPAGDGGPDTAAFTVLGHVGARSSTRVRVLAGAAVAAVALLIGGIVASLAHGSGGSPASPQPPSPPATSAPAAPPPNDETRPTEGVPDDKRERGRDRDDDEGKQKGKGKGRSGHDDD
jgi:hypothetical protein